MKIIRIPNLIIIILTQYLLRICVIGTFYDFSAARPALSEFDFALLVLSTLLIAAGGYIYNDIRDVASDKINKPAKVMVGKEISISNAYLMYYIFSIAGIVVGFYLAITVRYFLLGFIYVAIVLLLWFYTEKYQKTFLTGNIMISLLSAMVIFIVWLFELFALRDNPLIYAEVMKQLFIISIIVTGYGVFAFLVSMIREIFKDIEDLEGDTKEGYKTLPIALGTKKSKWFAGGLIIMTILLLAWVQYLLYKKGIILVFWYLMVAVQSLLLFLLFYIKKAKQKDDFHFLSNATKIIMVAGILSMQLFYVSF